MLCPLQLGCCWWWWWWGLGISLLPGFWVTPQHLAGATTVFALILNHTKKFQLFVLQSNRLWKQGPRMWDGEQEAVMVGTNSVWLASEERQVQVDWSWGQGCVCQHVEMKTVIYMTRRDSQQRTTPALWTYGLQIWEQKLPVFRLPSLWHQ